jgi:phage-related protein
MADLKSLIKNIREDFEKGFKGLDKAIQDSVGKKPIKVPVQTDTGPLEEKIRKTRVPKVPVELDPVVAAFQQEVRRQTAALARTVNVKVPVEGDTGNLRAELGASLAAIQAQSRIKVPTEPGDKTSYQAKLKAQLAEVAARVKQTVHIEAKVDVDGGRGGGGIGGLSAGLKGLFSALPSIGAVSSGVADLIGSFQKLGGTSAQAGGAVAGAAQSAAGPVGLLVGVLATAAAAAVALSVGFAAAVPVLGVAAAGLAAVAGAAAAIPGALAGAGAAFGTLSLGFKGISDAFKPKAGGGGGGGGGEDPASRARRIAGAERGVESARRGIAAATRGLQAANRGLEQAERGVADAQARVADAQRRALQAQQAVNRARKEAKEDIEDLNRSLNGAKLSEEDATLRVTEALRELNAVKEKGVLPDIQRADLEYRQAQQALLEAKDTTEDLGEAARDANAKGIEGSDKVQDALQDQVEAQNAVRDAVRGVADAQIAVIEAQNGVLSANDSLKASYDGLLSAQESLAEAQKKSATAGGGGGGLGDVVKLAPAAQKFVNAIKALKPAFEALRLDVQQRLFAGLDKTVTKLGNAWIPALKTTLGSYADTFNGFFKTLGANISTPQFITQLQAGAEGARKGLDAIGKAISGPLVQAFGRLSEASAPFLEKVGTVVAKLITDFSTWINTMDKAKLDGFFKKAGDAFADLGVTVKESGRLIGNLFGIIFRGNGKNDKSAITSFNDGLRKVNEWFEDSANQQRIAKFFDDLKGYYEDFKQKFSKAKEILDKILPTDGSGQSAASSLGTQIGSALISGVIAGIGQTLTLQNGVLADLFLNNPFSLIGNIKRLLGIKSPSTVMAEIGKNLIEGLMQGITGNLEGLRTKAGEIRAKISEGIGDAKGFLIRKGQDFATGLRNGLQAAQPIVQAKANDLKTRVGNAFANARTFLSNPGRYLTIGLSNGMGSQQGTLSARAQGLRTTVTNALRDAGSWLYNHGYNTVIGLWNGIASLGGWLYNKVANFIQDNIKNPVKNYLGINSPSRLAAELGRQIPAGLAVGIEAGNRQVERAAQAMAAAALPEVGSVGVDLGVESDAAISRALSVAGANKVQLEIGPGFTGDWLVDGLRRSIKFSHRGDPVAAFATS